MPADTRGLNSTNPLAPLLDVATALVSSLVLEEALHNVAAAIGQAMKVSAVDIHTYDPESDTLLHAARWDERGPVPEATGNLGSRISVKERPSWRAVLEGEILEFHVTDDSLPPEEREIYRRFNQKTTLDAPLIAAGEVMGTLGVVQRDRVRMFSPLERDLFRQFCGVAAIGIHNARVFNEEREQLRHLETLTRAGRLATSATPADDVLAQMVRAAAEGLGVGSAAVYACEPGAETLTCRAHRPAGSDQPVSSQLFRPALVGKPAAVIVERVDDKTLKKARREAVAEAGLHVSVLAPLWFDGRRCGLLHIGATDALRPFTAADLQLVEGLAAQAAVALQRPATHKAPCTTAEPRVSGKRPPADRRRGPTAT